jgi:integrase
LTYAEAELSINTWTEHFADSYNFFLCAFRTGMRLGELLALEWRDIDWNSQFIVMNDPISAVGSANPKIAKTVGWTCQIN